METTCVIPVRNSGSWILTHSGRHVELPDPDPEEIVIEDIARGLSRECRFSGQCQDFYSVAQHSVLASRIVEKGYALEALLHDAAEAYLRDIPQPLKRLMPEYSRIERKFDQVIRHRFGLPDKMSAFVHQADRVLLATEKRDLMAHDPWPWPILDGIEPLPDRIVPWSGEIAMKLFLYRFEELMEETMQSDEPEFWKSGRRHR
ncbi:HD family hydrolase [Leptospirillum ferriphilum]|uniref:Phosphohydrolase n=1 Tax=Leptospirillum ferriphilum TaxID=178606 RepID=A0A1V3SV83_9BACT|nr:hypothetical protein [Leptospirillum ferriphilum]OOH72776.1 hypothetical protein BOX24_05150 [Leptospirillum ferriphilum]